MIEDLVDCGKRFFVSSDPREQFLNFTFEMTTRLAVCVPEVRWLHAVQHDTGQLGNELDSAKPLVFRGERLIRLQRIKVSMDRSLHGSIESPAVGAVSLARLETLVSLVFLTLSGSR